MTSHDGRISQGEWALTLKITEKELDGVTVVRIKGQILLGEESSAFREMMKGLLLAGKKRIILDVADVTYIDSAGLARWWLPSKAHARTAPC
jgi:anti-anti-sigma factor